MDDSWQLRGANRPPSQWVNWQGPTNQVDMGPVRYPNPYITQEICVIERTVRQEPSFPNMLSLNSQSVHSRTGKPNTPHPMLAMTQENLQQFHADYQQTAISRTSYLASNQPWHSTNSSEGGGWPLMASGNPSLMGKLGTQANPAIMPEFFQGVQGGDMSQLSRAGGTGPVMSRSGSMEMYKQPFSVTSHLGEMDLQHQYQIPLWQSENRSTMYIEKHTPSLHKSASQPVVDSSPGLIREQAHRKPLLRPRVFCAGISGLLFGGELTMSETGRLGVICSCHGLHMSVAKFSEHAGLFAVNPGSSVLMEGGESMAQWRKSFFSQFGVKVPEDHVGWDWDERNGAEGDGLTQREVHAQGMPKQADAFLQGDCTVLKNKVNLHSSLGLGSSNVSRGRSAGSGFIHANPGQDLGTMESTVLEKSYKGFTGINFNENQAVSQKPYDFTNKNQGSNSTHLFWGNEVGASSVTDHSSFSKVGGQPSKHMMENSSAFSGGSFKKVVELCSGRYTAQEMEQVENELATSNFELRLGQPSQQNLSLGSIYSNSLQSRGSCGSLSQSKAATYEMASSQSAWEQTCHQSVDRSVMGRPATFGGFMGQSNEGTYTTNWFSNNQKNRDFGVPQVSQESDKQLGGFHQMHARTFPDVHTLQMFPSMRKHPEDTDVPYVEGSYHADIMMQPSDNRSSGEQRRVELSSSDYSTFTTLNAFQNDPFKEAGSDPQCHQSSALLIRPTVKTLEGVRNVEGMFMSPLERPRPLMGPPETMASAAQSSAMKSIIMQAAAARSGACESPLTSWAKQVSCLTVSESLSSCGPTKLQEHASSTIVCPKVDEVSTQQRLLVQAENHNLAEEAGPSILGSSTVNASPNLVRTSEGSRDYENQGFHQQNDSSRSSQDTELVITNPPRFCTDSGLKSRNEYKSVPHGGSLVLGEKSVSETPEEVYNGTDLDKTHTGMLATRASVQDVKCKEVFSDPMVTNYSGSDKCCLSDEAITKSDVDAEADSDGVAITTLEAPLPFRSPDRLDKPSFDGDSANAKLVEKRSSRRLCGTVECTAKELVRNDLLDEGSGIGKCCSSIEADMEAMTSAGPVSSHAYVQVLESQTSMANSSSSNAVISDTLSNSVRVRKLFMEVDKSTTATQAAAQYGAAKSIHRIDKRGRKTLKMKCLDVSSFPEGEGKERFSRVEEKGPISVSRKTLVSDDALWVPTAKGLKRKRSALNSGPDPTSSKAATVFGEGTSRGFDEEEHALKRKGLKVVLRPPEETFGKQTIETSLFSNEKLSGKTRRAKFPDLNSTYANNACPSMKASLASGREKSKNMSISGSSMKNGRGIVDRHDLKAVKMASLSSILEVPKARTGFQSKRVTDSSGNMLFNPPQPNISQSRFRQMKGWPVGGAPGVLAHPNGGVDDRSLTKLESHKQSSWEMPSRLVSRATGISAGTTVDCKPTGFGLRSNQKISRMSEFKGTMVTVPLKFIAAKRLEPEVLRKETKGLSISSADHSNLSSGPVKRLRTQVAHAKTVPYNHVSHIQSKGLVSNDEEDEVKPVRKRRKRRRRPRSTLNTKLKQSFVCCICGESSIQSNNVIVKCSCCGLGVHQACYGVTEVSKKPWTCRPCKVQATNIACVLCGYGEGAMTRAKKSGVLAKGLLQAWQDKKEADSLNFNHCASSTAVDIDQSHGNPCQCDCRNGQTNCKLHDALKKDEVGTGLLQEDCNVVRNSVADGIKDPTVAQWVHVVCALWMPGTRCTNVETMAAFDVSGVGSAPRKWVCSICKRAGGACIKCRVAKCSTPFHPWCAHGKGLLQNEAFGGEEEKVGFFGKCLLHGNLTEACMEEAPITESAAAESQSDNSTCARTEGGYKRGETSFGKKVIDSTSLGILQEDVTAWLSIKEHKRSTRRFIKLANSDVRTHHREYVRYKQEQSWKRLAVYKSSIHALGLYTSENIAKGEMVVEYVGEIIGLRVADKREAAYLSNGRLQYRGACYLFRIDKEHIIDATHKGGIARFVNHSCSPNCVAKIISVEKQKKVVFFAEKDIAAGEELTYDYKLDFETDNRIPCYCKSPECRGFLN